MGLGGPKLAHMSRSGYQLANLTGGFTKFPPNGQNLIQIGLAPQKIWGLKRFGTNLKYGPNFSLSWRSSKMGNIL